MVFSQPNVRKAMRVHQCADVYIKCLSKLKNIMVAGMCCTRFDTVIVCLTLNLDWTTKKKISALTIFILVYGKMQFVYSWVWN